MKKFYFLLPALLLAIFGCATSPEAPAGAKKLKTALYTQKGSWGSGVLYLARIVARSPQAELKLVDAAAVKAGALKDVELLIIPGGSSQLQCQALGEEGKEIIRKFVKEGGSYVGICAGFHCTLNKPDRIGLMPFEYRQGAGGAAGPVKIEISKRGAEVLGVAPGLRQVKYSRGPISKPGAPWAHGKAEILGVYKSTISPAGKPGGDFLDAPAVIFGNYGKGKVIATSFHPEADAGNEEIVLGCIAAVTGIRLTPIPPKSFRPLRAGYYFGPAIAKSCIGAAREFLALDADPRVVLKPTQEFADNIDIMILPDGEKKSYAGFTQKWRRGAVTRFVDRGGIVLASETAAANLPVHPAIIKVARGGSYIDAAVKAAPRPATEKTPVAEGKRVRTLFYTDNGALGAGMLKLARLLCSAPMLEVSFVKGVDLRKGALNRADLLVCPGGGSGRQLKAMGPEGAKAVLEFLRRGGGYLGVCAGAYNTLPVPVRLGVLPFEAIPRASGTDSKVSVEITKRGAEVMGIPAGAVRAKFNGGPIMRPRAGAWPHGKGEVLALYKSTVSWVNRPAHQAFFDSPAIIYGNYGKGRVIGISFHPEKMPATSYIIPGAVYAVTGVKSEPVFPLKQFRPLRTGYFPGPAIGKNCAEAIGEFLTLDRRSELTVNPTPFEDRIIEDLDVLILPEGLPGAYKNFRTGREKQLELLLARGGRIVACEEAAAVLAGLPGVTVLKKGGTPLQAVLSFVK